ncbi:MAG: hypothetical protein ABI091_26120 [Ferruginibacter sp.]
MKFNLILIIIILFTACNQPSQQKTGQQKPTEQTWQISDAITKTHSYNKSGLLDSTVEVENIYLKGIKADAIKILIAREYDKKNNLLSEREYQVFKKHNELSNEILYKYDDRNNPVIITEKNKNIISKIVKNTYNSKDQKTEEIDIQKKLPYRPSNWTLDSAVAHDNDKIIPRYDTSIISYEYDANGNQITKIYKNANRVIREKIIILFSGNKKTASYGISPKGDTISITQYKRNGNLVTEINQDKNDLLYNETNLYDGDKLIEAVFIDKGTNFNTKETYKYDSKGNEIEKISYK